MSAYEQWFRQLDEVGSLSRGKSKHRPRNDPILYGGPHPFIQTGDVKHSSFYVTSYSQTYSDKGLAQSKLWPAGTLCITIAANIADTAILTFPACFPDSIIGFKAKDGVASTAYVKYCLDTYKTQMRSISQGTTQDNLSQGKLLSLKFRIPDFQTQQNIAAILSPYDDLIANNQRRITLLERMAEDIYCEWFVRLRFPGYEQVNFEKGVPQGWSPSTLGAVADFTMGQSPSSEYFNDAGNGLPFHQGVGSYGPRYPSHDTFCSVSGRKAKPGDILFSVRAPVGRINIADRELIIGRGLAAIRHKRGMNGYLLYLLTVTFASEDIIGNGSIFNSVGKDELARLGVFEPNFALVEKFEALVQPIDQKVAALYQANASLKSTRDALLPRLISGKLAVDGLDIKSVPQ